MLFGGGQARLVLTGEEILDSGVQVVAQPPGKRNTSIHLLSGGEKALTAISLVFALFQLNPAPFCLLDEVDAPLDDPNTDRFCRMVQAMAGETQFLFISHNKITMEMASQLIGITMPEPGRLARRRGRHRRSARARRNRRRRGLTRGAVARLSIGRRAIISRGAKRASRTRASHVLDRMTSLQLGLIVGGVVLVVGVLIYNWLQERRVRRRIDDAFGDTAARRAARRPPAAAPRRRVEPTLARRRAIEAAMPRKRRGRDADAGVDDDAGVRAAARDPVTGRRPTSPPAAPRARRCARRRGAGARRSAACASPIPTSNAWSRCNRCAPVSAGAIAAGLHARARQAAALVRPARPDAPWQRLKSDTAGEFTEIAACLLLADRAGAATRR